MVKDERGSTAAGNGRPPGRSGTITLRDVANETHVSITTVSRILNGRASGVPIREDTRQRVVDAAAALGYTPNLLARALRGSRSSLLGVIARDVTDPFHIQVLRGINDAAQLAGYRLFLGHVDYRPETAIAYGSMFERSHADGIVVVGDIEGGEDLVDALAQQHRYIVGVTDRTHRRAIPGVYVDSVAGTRLAIDHLLALGHRRIACVTDEVTADGRARAAEYERLLRDQRAADAIAVHTVANPGTPEPAYRLGQLVFGSSDEQPPTAIYATSDTIAIGLMQAAFEAGLTVPGNVSIVGYDDIDLAGYVIPPLTTVSQSGVEMGRRAAELLLRMIAEDLDRATVDDIVIEPRLVVRGSTAPPRA
ncbi:MAG: LacI family DNA-binding transcriptional regulator [Chloroflexota bacterium]